MKRKQHHRFSGMLLVEEQQSASLRFFTMSVKLNALNSDSYIDISQYRDQHFKVNEEVVFRKAVTYRNLRECKCNVSFS